MLILAFSDYEALEIALACHVAYGDPAVPIFIVHNGRKGYDTERTLKVAKRYAWLHPGRITVIAYRKPRHPYIAIRQALAEQLAGFALICKVDDDAFPIAPGWLDRLLAAREAAAAEGRPAALVTPLINNNTSGFARVVDAMGLRDEFDRDVSMAHRVGAKGAQLVPKGEIVAGTNGTVWALPHAARWVHEKTTLEPDAYIAATAALPNADLPSAERYSIGCILFERGFWTEMAADFPEPFDDEGMTHHHVARHGLRLLCVQSVPFVHIAYWTQREENRDLVPRIREVYAERLALPYPISLYGGDRLLEIEARLRWQGQRRQKGKPRRRGLVARLLARLTRT